jgi:hypothetical protein
MMVAVLVNSSLACDGGPVAVLGGVLVVSAVATMLVATMLLPRHAIENFVI